MLARFVVYLYVVLVGASFLFEQPLELTVAVGP
jgi:hypothetical protein